MEAIPIVLNWGPLGLLAVALVTVVRGDWMPKFIHDKIVSLYVKSIEERDARIKEQNEEIQRLQTRLDEQVNSSLASTMITSKSLEALTRALPPPSDVVSHRREGA
jgi:hypothetical protein